jgi:nudix-type nucleoside diphosphatase (YffH/AdpP family)
MLESKIVFGDHFKGKSMPKRVEIISKKEVFKKFIFKVEEAHLRYERYNGMMTDEIVRLNLNRGDSTAAIVHNKKDDMIVLVEQFRYSTYDKGPGWMLEIPAGIIDPDLDPDPAATMRREIEEEIGYTVDTLRLINRFYLSPGGSSERIYLYYTTVTPKQRTGKGGGVMAEGENIRIMPMKLETALHKMDKGEIVDAKTIIALQWLKMSRS